MLEHAYLSDIFSLRAILDKLSEIDQFVRTDIPLSFFEKNDTSLNKVLIKFYRDAFNCVKDESYAVEQNEHISEKILKFFLMNCSLTTDLEEQNRCENEFKRCYEQWPKKYSDEITSYYETLKN